MGAKLTAADRAEIVARADAGATQTELAAEFGVSRGRVGQIVREAADAEAAAATDDPAFAALCLRYRRGLEIVCGLNEQERFELFAAVVCPSRALAEASRRAALEQLGGQDSGRRRRAGYCSGCGVSFDDSPTRGCKPCGWRETGRRKWQRLREEREGTLRDASNVT